MSAGVTLTERQGEVLRVLAGAGGGGLDYWELREALGRSPMQSVRVLRHKGLVDASDGRFYVARPRPDLTVVADPDDPSDEPGEMGHDGTTNHEAEEDRYVISDERLAEIKGLLNDRHAGWQVVPSPGVTVYDLAGAVDDLLCEREDRLRG